MSITNGVGRKNTYFPEELMSELRPEAKAGYSSGVWGGGKSMREA